MTKVNITTSKALNWLSGSTGSITAIAITAVLCSLAYTMAEIFTLGEIGFPLDDTWIHLVFARNISQGSGFSFNPGDPVSGSTAPLWTLLLAASQYLPGETLVWAKIWGIVFLWFTGTLVYLIAKLYKDHGWLPLFLGLITILTPRMVWASLSGMEITLFTSLTLVAFYFYLTQSRNQYYSLISTVFFALATLVRPEGLAIFLLVMIMEWAIQSTQVKSKRGVLSASWKGAVQVGLFLIILIPYIIFNLQTAGILVPNTFPALARSGGLYMGLKNQNQRVILRSLTYFPIRAIPSLLYYFVFDNLILLISIPVSIWGFVLAVRSRRFSAKDLLPKGRWLAIPIALLGLPIIRVMVVPGQDVNYHMGRYVSIITPLFVLLSGIGLSTIIDLYGERIRRVPNALLVTITIGGLMIGVGMLLLVDNVVLDFARYIYGLRYHSIAFADRWFQIRLLIYTAFIGVMLIGIGIGVYGLASRWRKHDGVQISILNLWMFIALLMGALGVLLNIQLYTGQIANIQEMQVTMGKWAADSTPPDSLLAVNDIGAIGYYSDRRILDTLALINPEVIPFLLKGEKGIFELLVREQPDYLIVFPNWYPNITQLDALFTPVYDVSIEPNLICGARTMVAYKANWDNLALIQDEVDSW
jgi:hypothetical protein